MKASLVLFVFFFSVLMNQFVLAEPGFNGIAPGCSGSSCHTFQSGILTAVVESNLQIKFTLKGNSGKVAGELVDENGVVVAVMNPTSNNPFTLTAPSTGTFKVNAGFKSPNRRWDSTTVTIVLADIGDNLIESTHRTYKLNNNYPNPFNPSTKISYSIPRKSMVTLEVYDLAGNQISTLVNEEKSAGSYEVVFEASQLTSGVYFYTLRTGNYTETKKMVVLR
jgi:hypothetical protein